MKNLCMMLILCFLATTSFNTAIQDINEPSTEVREYIGENAHQTKAIFDRFINEAINHRNPDAITDLFDKNFSMYIHRGVEPVIQGREKFMKKLLQACDSNSNFQVDIKKVEFMAYNDRIAIIWDGGDFFDNLLPKFQSLQKKESEENLHGIAVYRFINGKITECRMWMYQQHPSLRFIEKIQFQQNPA